ncbi:MAG: hypothetical protein Q4F95_03975 [Oscillospiraceae bacterium]|nr:hypothetical protein [Oscillospiraceae bacterium]
MRKIREVEKNDYASYFIISMIIFLSSSFVITNSIYPSFITIGLWFFTFVYIIVKNIYTQFDNIYNIIVIVILMMITTIINKEEIRPFVLITFTYLSTYIFAESIDFEKFRKAFVTVVYILCIISLICFSAYLIIPALSKINVVYNVHGEKYSNLFIYVNTNRYIRNTGIFWEPGAFQTFINLACLLEISKDNINIKKVLIFFLTDITTYSTTAYLTMIFLIILFYIKQEKSSKKKKIMSLFLGVVLIFVYFNQDVLFGSSFNGQITVFGKLSNFDADSSDSIGEGSASVRYNAIIQPIICFFQKPLFGNGNNGLALKTYDYTSGMNTCTFVNYFAVFGLLYGSIMTVGIIRFLKKCYYNLMEVIVALIIFFFCTMSENYISNTAILLFILLGLKKEMILNEEVHNENSLH